MNGVLPLYLSIFAWLFFTGIGLPPLPEEAGILYAASLHATNPEMNWAFAWLATGSGIIGADLVLYGIGRRWGPKLFELKWIQRVIKEERRIRLEGRFHQHGMKLLILARFLPPLRTGVFLVAGASRYSFVKFAVADLIYVLTGVGAFLFGGSYVIGLFSRLHGKGGHPISWLLLTAATLYALYRYYEYLRKRENARPAEAPRSIAGAAAGALLSEGAKKDPTSAPAASTEAKAMLKE